MAEVGLVRLIRPPGRRTLVEEYITQMMLRTANTMRSWLIENDKIATGTAAGNLRVVVSRQARPDRRLQKFRSSLTIAGFGDISEDLKDAQNALNLTNLGLVNAQVQGVPYLNFALQGRRGGKMPPIAAIIQWLLAKGIASQERSINQSAFLIARKIGREGTNPPYFTSTMLTTITRASSERMIRSISEPLAKAVGRKFVRFLIKAGKEYDNIRFSSETVTESNEDQDQN